MAWARLACCGLQYLITWLSVRSKTISRMVKAEPSLLFYRGAFLPDAMRAERVVEAEIYAVLRAAGVAHTDGVEAVVLETDGSFTVIPHPASGGESTLDNLTPSA